MALYMISYDLDKPGQDYPDLINRLEQLGARRILFSQWFYAAQSATNVKRLYDAISEFLDQNDRIVIVELTNNALWENLMIDDSAVRTFFANARS